MTVRPAACRLAEHDRRRNHHRSRGAGLGVRGRGWSCSREDRPYYHTRCSWRSMPLWQRHRFAPFWVCDPRIIAAILGAAYRSSIITPDDTLYRWERISPIPKCNAKSLPSDEFPVGATKIATVSGPNFRTQAYLISILGCQTSWSSCRRLMMDRRRRRFGPGLVSRDRKAGQVSCVDSPFTEAATIPCARRGSTGSSRSSRAPRHTPRGLLTPPAVAIGFRQRQTVRTQRQGGQPDIAIHLQQIGTGAPDRGIQTILLRQVTQPPDR